MPLRRKNLLMLEKATFNQTWPSICSFPVRARKGFLFVLVWIKNIPRNLSFLYFASVWNQWQWNLQSLHWRWLYNHSSFPSFKDIYNFFSLVFVCKRVISFLLFEGHQVGATRPLTALLTNHSENSEKSALTKKEILTTIRKASSDLWTKFLHDDLVQLKYNELASWKIRNCILKSSWTSWSSHLCRPAPLGKLSLLKRLRFSIS